MTSKQQPKLVGSAFGSSFVGEPQFLEIWSKNKSKDHEWHISKIDIWHQTKTDKVLEKSEDMDYDSMDGKQWTFLVYRWIGEKVFVHQPYGITQYLRLNIQLAFFSMMPNKDKHLENMVITGCSNSLRT